MARARTCVRGCTSQSAINYNPLAAVDDGSCTPVVYGCNVPAAANFDPAANSYDGSCLFPATGCTSPTAVNYVATAVVDDGSCIERVLGCMVPLALNYDPAATVDDGSCVYAASGCTDSRATNYEPSAASDDGTCRYPGCTNSLATNFDPSADVDDGHCALPVRGCTDPTAANYFAAASLDDGSCVVLGCTDSAAPNYQAAATHDDGSCVTVPHIVGCADSLASNYLANANVPNATQCRYGGCTDAAAQNFDPSADFDDGTCVAHVRGCTASAAVNYQSAAGLDDGSRLYLGCTDSYAVNFDASASADDGSCAYQRASGRAVTLGYMQDCSVFVDANDNLVADGAEAVGASNNMGLYSATYLSHGPLQVFKGAVGRACVDSITGSALGAHLRSTANASITSPLTSVAMHLLPSVGASGASAAICSNVVPCVPCRPDSAQPCQSSTSCLDTCTDGGAALSVFTFDALSRYLLASQLDPAWAAWLVAQLNTMHSMVCALDALSCASPELCGANCATLCAASGGVGSYTRAQVADALYGSLAEMAAAAPVQLEGAGGAAVLELINRGAARLGVASRDASAIAASCGTNNAQTYQLMTGAATGRRLRMEAAGRRRASRGWRRSCRARRRRGGSAAATPPPTTTARSRRRTTAAASTWAAPTRPAPPTRRAPTLTTARAGRPSRGAATRARRTTCRTRGPTGRTRASSAAARTRRAQLRPVGHRGRQQLRAAPVRLHRPHRGQLRVVRDGRRRLVLHPRLHRLARAQLRPARATADDHSCEVVLGCTDANGADNYNPLASVDDGSCVYVGCTSSAAINFAANATVDDGRCEHLPDAFAAFAWQLPRTVAPLVFNDGAIRRFTFAGARHPDATSLLAVGDEAADVGGAAGAGAVHLLHYHARGGAMAYAGQLQTYDASQPPPPSAGAQTIGLRALDAFGSCGDAHP